MRKKLFFSFALIAIGFVQLVFAQTKDRKNFNQNYFDEKTAHEQAKAKGMQGSEINGYIQFLKNDFSSKKALEKQVHKHTPYEVGSGGIQETIIYLEPNKPMSLGCPNMSFEQYNFNGWTGGIGSVITGPAGGNPTYSPTGTAIINTAGDNVSVLNTINYHTIMTLPPTNNVYPNCSGYDSLACKAVGSQTISEVPFISPYSFDPVSVRLNNANGSQASRLKYITTTASNNQKLSFSFAVIFQDPTSPAHASNEAPYFKVEVRNESTGLSIPGCSSDDFNPKTAAASDSLKTSLIQYSSVVVKYRKWTYYTVDLSSLPSGTSVSVNFEVGGCSLGSHIGYAYVDAECGGFGTPYANMCSGSNFATLVAPAGFTSYQWSGPSGIIPGATNDTLIENPATVGTTYTVDMISPSGCLLSQTVAIGFTFVSATNLNSTSSCAGGNSGTASVLATGSNGVYTYTWTNIATGLPVSYLQTATGLAPGSYGVLVASTTCGQDGGTLTVGVSPPFFFSQSKSFCGNATTIIQPNGSNYTWYHNSTIIPAPNGTNDTLKVDVAVPGDIYTVVYKNSQGCRDSLAYTLHEITGGNVYFSNINNVCPNDSNGSVVLNLNTPFSAPYNYFVTGPNNSIAVIDTTTSLTSVTLSPLAPGTYNSVINDGVCIYNNTFNIGVIQTNFTVTAADSVKCFPEVVTINLNYDQVLPPSCGFDPLLCTGPPTQLFTTGPFTQNGATTYPTPYGNYYTNGRTQFLIRKSELNASGIFGGKISSLAFNVLNINSSATSYPDFSLKIGCTNLSELPNATIADQSFISGLQTVYSNANQPITLGWLTHNFSQSYLWDGNSNIIIEVCFSFPGTFNFSENVSVELKNVSYISSMYHVDDSAPVCGGTQLADNNGISGMVTNGINMLPNLKFGYCPYYLPASSYTVTVSSNGTITNTYNNDSIKVAPTFTTPPVGTGSVIYTVSVTNPIGGCVATNTVEIFYPPLTTTVTTVISDSTLCEGDNTTLTASGASIYNWYYQTVPGGSLTPISGSSSINVIPPSIGTNTYVVTGNAPCAGSVPDTNTIRVYITPKANLLITSLQDVTKCLNKAFILIPDVNSTTQGNPGTPYSYSWTTLPGNLPAPGNNTDSSYIETSNSTTTLVVTVNGVCANSANDEVVVNNFADDLSIFISNADTTCPNKPLTLNSNVTGGHPLFNYTWAINSNIISNTANLTYTSPSTGGTYSVEVTVIDSCGYQKSDADVIYVLPNTLNISIIDSISLCGNTAFELHSISSGGYSDYNYQWYLIPNTNSISNTSGLSYTTPPTEGLYTIQVVISDSCGYQQSDFQVINVLPPCQVEIPNIITPNGDNVNDYFIVNNLEYHTNTRVTIFDRWGRKVYENPNYNNEWKADGVGDGTYFYVIEVPDDKSYSGFVTVFKDK